ncbi:hypothetical protein B0H21DRAFT_287368 [Amylocystis lapponica]|nr:hypothetical protein B0H21DRAFT_287368 [Amylocystis lapponica]
MSTETRVAIVTGAAQGLGEAIALRLADDGLDVAVNDLQAKNDLLQAIIANIRGKGRRAVAVAADVSSEEQVKGMVATVVDQLGGVNVMVANAGILLGVVPIVEMDVALWDKVMAVNARGVMLCYKYAALQMIKQGRGGRIIGASSIGGKRAAKHASAYCASKFAIRGLTQTASQELAPHNITVNSYAPGAMRTEMMMHADDAIGGKAGDIAKLLGLPPDIPNASPGVIASIVSYLAKPEAYFITGQSITVDGGVTLD